MPNSLPTSQDSYKMPIILLAIGPRGSLEKGDDFGITSNEDSLLELRTPGPITDTTPIFTNVGREKFLRINMEDAIEEFTYSVGGDRCLIATIRLYDPEFDRYFSYFSTAKAEALKYSVYFQFGYSVDGADGQKLSGVHECAVTEIYPDIQGGEMHLTVSMCNIRTTELVSAKPAVSFPAGMRPELMAQALVEMDIDSINAALSKPGPSSTGVSYLEQQLLDQVRNPARVPRLEIDPHAICHPYANNGQPGVIVPSGESPIAFIRRRLVGMNSTGGRSVPVNDKFKNQPVYFTEDATENGVYRWTVGGTSDAPKRRYVVGRGDNGQVLSFIPQESARIADILGGGGVEEGVDASKPKGDQIARKDRGEITADPDLSDADSVSRSMNFSRHSPARDLETLSQERVARWNRLQSVATSVDAEIIGDPHINLLDDLEFIVLAGGNIATSGRYTDTSSGDIRNHPTVVKWLSGRYLALSVTHIINMAGYRTLLNLTPLGSKTPLSVTDEPNSPEDQRLDNLDNLVELRPAVPSDPDIYHALGVRNPYKTDEQQKEFLKIREGETNFFGVPLRTR